VRLNSVLIRQNEIDGQIVYIVDTKAFELLVNNPEIEDQPIYALDTVFNMMDYVQKYSFFSLAIFPLGNQNKWMFCLLLDKNQKLQRVQIENVQCKVCDWKGEIANPTIPELYYGCPDRWGALEEASKIPTVQCPSCNSKLPRYSIWASS
jgi:hypothetical protein